MTPRTRIIRTLKQSAIAAGLTAAIAVMGNVTDVTSTEFGTKTWYPLVQMGLTGVVAFLMNLKKENDGGENPS